MAKIEGITKVTKEEIDELYNMDWCDWSPRQRDIWVRLLQERIEALNAQIIIDEEKDIEDVMIMAGEVIQVAYAAKHNSLPKVNSQEDKEIDKKAEDIVIKHIQSLVDEIKNMYIENAAMYWEERLWLEQKQRKLGKINIAEIRRDLYGDCATLEALRGQYEIWKRETNK